MSGPTSLAGLQALSAGKLRGLLAARGVNDAGCLEKADFVALAARVLGFVEGGDARRSHSEESLKSCWTSCRTPSASSSPKRRSPSRESLGSSDTGSSSAAERRRRKRRDTSDYGSETVKISPDEFASMAMGSKVLDKVSRVSECEVHLKEKEMSLDLRGTPIQRRRARKYAGFVMKQRMGPSIFADSFDDGDMTIISIPPDVVGYVQGQNGVVLRAIEEEWGADWAL